MLVVGLVVSRPCPAAAVFVDVSAAAGVALSHQFEGDVQLRQEDLTVGGIAVADYDADGWLDVYLVRGTTAPNALLRNNRDGTFTDVGAAAGVALQDYTCGPTFADVDGDGWVDLLVLGTRGAGARLFRNRGDGTFSDITHASGLGGLQRDSYSAAFGDYDRDGDLDFFVSHWATFGRGGSTQHLWNNDGRGHFTDVSRLSQVMQVFLDSDGETYRDFSFTPNFIDYDADGWPDLLIAADFLTTKLLHNEGNGTFRNATTDVLSDENGMGAALGDYDNDGDVDWFVSSIWDPTGIPPQDGNWGVSGNRLYRNDAGSFVDATEIAGVRQGYWGWGSLFADLDNDGWLDLVHVNGWGPRSSPEAIDFHDDPLRSYLNQRDGTFREAAAEMGLHDTRQGRGIVAFDYDRDGDLDLFVSNNQEPARLFRNDAAAGAWLAVGLRGAGSNTAAIGARVFASATGLVQRRDVRAGNNFVSQDPFEVHFGLGAATHARELRVEWPEPGIPATVWRDVPVGELVQIGHPEWLAAGCAGDCDGDGATRIDDLLRLVSIALGQRGPSRCVALEAYPVEVDQVLEAVRASLECRRSVVQSDRRWQQ